MIPGPKRLESSAVTRGCSTLRRLTMRTPWIVCAVPLPIIVALNVFGLAPVAAQPAVQLTGVRLDNAFQLVGSNASGLVVSITLKGPQSRRTSDDFALVLFDAGRRSGSNTCLAMRFLDGADSKPPWLLLDDSTGTLARGYRTLVDSHAAVIEHARKKTMEMAGRYELVYLVSTNNDRAALAYGNDVAHRLASDLDREGRLVASFKVPWQ